MAVQVYEGESGGEPLQWDAREGVEGATVAIRFHRGDKQTVAWTPSSVSGRTVFYAPSAGDIPAGSAGTWAGVIEATYPSGRRQYTSISLTVGSPFRADALAPALRATAGESVYNVTNYPTIQEAIDAVPNGATLGFPPGTYNVPAALRVENRTHLTFRGAGPGTVLRRTGAAPDQRMLQIGGDENTPKPCEHIGFRDLTVDVNGITRFGGIAIYNTTGVTACDVWLTDSNLLETWQTWDHLGFVIQLSTDVDLRRIHARNVELAEINLCRRVRVKDWTSIGAAGTAALGFYAHPGLDPYAEDYEFTDGLCIDPRKFGIAVSQELNAKNTTVRGFLIARNHIRHVTIPGAASIGLGYTAGVDATTENNDWAGFEIEDNRIDCIAPGRATHAIFARHNQTSFRFRRMHVRRNLINGQSSEDQVFLRQMEDGSIVGNKVQARVEKDGNGDFQRAVTARGMRLEIMTGNEIDWNIVEATERAYTNQGSGGGNRVAYNRLKGTPTTSWTRDGSPPPSDVYLGNDGLI